MWTLQRDVKLIRRLKTVVYERQLVDTSPRQVCLHSVSNKRNLFIFFGIILCYVTDVHMIWQIASRESVLLFFTFVHFALKLYLHYLVEFEKFISSVYNSTTMSEMSLPADTLITFMPQICHVSIGVWYTRSCVTPQMRYRAFRIRVFPVNHLHWHYWQPNLCQLFSDFTAHTCKVFSCDQSRHPLLDHWETAFAKC